MKITYTLNCSNYNKINKLINWIKNVYVGDTVKFLANYNLPILENKKEEKFDFSSVGELDEHKDSFYFVKDIYIKNNTLCIELSHNEMKKNRPIKAQKKLETLLCNCLKKEDYKVSLTLLKYLIYNKKQITLKKVDSDKALEIKNELAYLSVIKRMSESDNDELKKSDEAWEFIDYEFGGTYTLFKYAVQILDNKLYYCPSIIDRTIGQYLYDENCIDNVNLNKISILLMMKKLLDNFININGSEMTKLSLLSLSTDIETFNSFLYMYGLSLNENYDLKYFENKDKVLVNIHDFLENIDE